MSCISSITNSEHIVGTTIQNHNEHGWSKCLVVYAIDDFIHIQSLRTEHVIDFNLPAFKR